MLELAPTPNKTNLVTVLLFLSSLFSRCTCPPLSGGKGHGMAFLGPSQWCSETVLGPNTLTCRFCGRPRSQLGAFFLHYSLRAGMGSPLFVVSEQDFSGSSGGLRLSAHARNPQVPLCIARHESCTAPDMWDRRGASSGCALLFSVVHVVTGPVLHPLRHALQQPAPVSYCAPARQDTWAFR